jgi:hypothetical protein
MQINFLHVISKIDEYLRKREGVDVTVPLSGLHGGTTSGCPQ